MSAEVLHELEAALPAGTVVVDPATVDNHRRDRADLCPAGSPLALVRPRTTEQVQAISARFLWTKAFVTMPFPVRRMRSCVAL